MIPKIIHYTWFSGDPFPEIEQKCIESWHKFMPEYEYVLWDMNRLKKEFDNEFPIWLQESLSVRKWAFAADFVRQYAVYKYGGIYLDTDCLAFQSFNDVLDNHFFIGRESAEYPNMYRKVEVYLTSHCFGSEKGHPFLKRMLQYYEGRHFVTCTNEEIPNSLKYDMLMLPLIQAKIAELFGYQSKPSCSDMQYLSENVNIYPLEYFGVFGNCPETSKTHVRHLASGSWREYTKRNGVPKLSIALRLKIFIASMLSKILRHFNYILLKCD